MTAPLKFQHSNSMSIAARGVLALVVEINDMIVGIGSYHTKVRVKKVHCRELACKTTNDRRTTM